MAKSTVTTARWITVPMLVTVSLLSVGCGNDTMRLAEADSESSTGADISANETVVERDTNDVADVEPDTSEMATEADQDDLGDDPSDRVTSSNKGSRVCVQNETGSSTEIYVSFSKADSSNGGPLRAYGDDQKRCAEGTFFVGSDVVGQIEFFTPGANTYEFNAANPWFGLPTSALIPAKYRDEICIASEFAERDKATFDDGIYGISIERLADSRWKEFVITVRNTSEPTRKEVAKRCKMGMCFHVGCT